MEKSIDSVCDIDIVSRREAWTIKVRVVRIWQVSTFLKPDQTNSLEMVLIDEKGCKIQATVRKQLLYLFQQKLIEGEVYKMAYFSVVPNIGSYRTTPHPYKLIFQMKTRVQSCEGPQIPLYGLSFTNTNDVCSHTVDYDYLVDVIGVMTGIYEEGEFIRNGKITKIVVLELTDPSGKVECALFGEYVGLLQKLMGKGNEGMPVVVVQFAKIKIFRDKASVQNVMNATRLLINPDIAEAIQLKNGVGLLGIETSTTVPILGRRVRPSFDEEFLRLYAKKTIAQLADLPDDRTFIVSAIVDVLVEGEEWWYSACKCHRKVTPDSNAFYCKGCVKPVFHMVPRYKVKVRVSDGTGNAVFVLFDNDVYYLLGKQCSVLVSAAKAKNAGFYPPELILLNGKRILFKVEKQKTFALDGSYRVKRVCNDQSIIASFSIDDTSYTPTKPNPSPGVNLGSDEVGKKSVFKKKIGSLKRKLTDDFDGLDDIDFEETLNAVNVEKE